MVVVYQSVTLAPLSTIPALSVAWTLQYEVFFYLLFGCLYFIRDQPGRPLLEGNSYAFMVAVNVVWGIGIGLLYYWLVERPLLRVARNDPRHERLTGAEPLPAALSEVLEASPRSSKRRPKRPKA